MSFRNSDIDEVIILEGLQKEVLAKKIKELSDKYTLIDLQYAVSDRREFSPYKHHVIILLQRKT